MLMAGGSLVLLILVMIILACQYQQCWQMHQQALLALVDMSERMATMERKMDAVTKRVMQVAAMPPVESDTDRGSRVRREQSGLLEGTAGSKDAFSRRSSSQAGRVHSVTDTISRMPSSITSTELRAPSWPASSELSAVKHSDTDGGEMTFKRVVSDTLLRVPSTSRPLPPLSGAPSCYARGLAQENVSTEGKAGEQALKCPDERMMMSEGPTGVKQGSRKKERASPSAGMISPDDALWCTQPACVRARMHACMHTHTERVRSRMLQIYSYTHSLTHHERRSQVS